jgi:Cdc6-like AAA superfamily ATPase
MDSFEYNQFRGSYSGRLWLHGEQGDGKTVIMSYVLRNLSSNHHYTDKEDIASIFCSCNDSEEGVVASIAIQLLKNKFRPNAPLSNFPVSTFQPGHGRLDFNHLLWRLLTGLIRANPTAIFIIDGIDKLNFPVRSSFLDRFCKFEEELASTKMRVLISSEKKDDIQNALSHFSSIDREKERRGE